MKKTICWDVDDVFNNLTNEYVIWIKERSDIKHIDLHTNPPFIVGLTRNQYLESLDKFRLLYYQKLVFNYEILNWFKEYGDKFYHIALTSTPRKTAHISSSWITEYFGDWIQSINFVYSDRERDNSIKYFNNKSEWIEWFGKVDYFIDDNENNLKMARKWNPDLITFCPKCSWNSGEDIENILKKLILYTNN